LAYDNVSKIDEEMSDAYCRIATGGALEKRQLYTDGDLFRASFCCPLWINAIGDPVRKGDLGDRTVFYVAQPIETEKRKPSNEFWKEFWADRPKILGALYVVVAQALKAEAEGPIPKKVKLPRMARSAAWVYRCFTVLGWDFGKWLETLTEGQGVVQQDQLEGNALGAAVVKWFKEKGWANKNGLFGNPQPVSNTPADWVEVFKKYTPEKAQEYLPTAQTIRGKLRELAPALRRAGIEVCERGRGTVAGKEGRVITIRKLPPTDPQASPD
jgi:hypothetical protein